MSSFPPIIIRPLFNLLRYEDKRNDENSTMEKVEKLKIEGLTVSEGKLMNALKRVEKS